MRIINDNYTVNQLAKLAGVSVRTLHYYDQVGLLVPSVRTEANYRLYGEPELLRLQQILFYKELDIPLQQIAGILDDPDFDILRSLEQHRTAVVSKQQQLSVLLSTIDKTILTLKGDKVMLTEKELYTGFTREEVEQIRNAAIDKYGKDAVVKSENSLKKLTKEDILVLNKEREDIHHALLSLMDLPASDTIVQEQIKRHYLLTRIFWGTSDDQDTQKEAYSGLAELYLADDRFVTQQTSKEFTSFLSTAMKHFATAL